MVHHIPITKARINLGQVVRRAHLNQECFVLEKDGIPVAGIIGVDELEDYLELQDPKLKKQITEGYAAYEQGEARDFDDFLEELKGSGAKKKNISKKTR
jgi:antitoxin (DNA-binding transcriptional repressor) of toxin-antitoxin stability system